MLFNQMMSEKNVDIDESNKIPSPVYGIFCLKQLFWFWLLNPPIAKMSVMGLPWLTNIDHYDYSASNLYIEPSFTSFKPTLLFVKGPLRSLNEFHFANGVIDQLSHWLSIWSYTQADRDRSIGNSIPGIFMYREYECKTNSTKVNTNVN